MKYRLLSLINISFLIISITLSSEIYAAPSCDFTSSPNVLFGNYDPISPTPDDTQGSITVECSGGPRPYSYTITLSQGNSGTYFPRTMFRLFGGGTLNYNLYTNTTRTIVWGNGAGGTGSVARTVTTNPFSFVHPIYGRIPANQTAADGFYIDPVIWATVTF